MVKAKENLKRNISIFKMSLHVRKTYNHLTMFRGSLIPTSIRDQKRMEAQIENSFRDNLIRTNAAPESDNQ